MKSNRNKTIILSSSEQEELLTKCLTAKQNYSLEEITNKTICGDTFKILKKLPKESVNLIIADPPYNMDKNFNGKGFYKQSKEEYYRYTEEWLSATLPLLKPDGSIYVCCDWQSSLIVGDLLEKLFFVRNRITWQREKGRGAKNNWKNSMEDIWYATKSKDFVFNVDDVKQRRKVIAPYKLEGQPRDWVEAYNGKFRNTFPSNFWDDISIPYWSMHENTDHPTQKPEKLFAKLILASSNKGDLVFDPFLGSGTTSAVAKKLGRLYCGIEQSPYYCALTEKRLKNADEDTRIQGYTSGVFWERNTMLAQNKAMRKRPADFDTVLDDDQEDDDQE